MTSSQDTISSQDARNPGLESLQESSNTKAEEWLVNAMLRIIKSLEPDIRDARYEQRKSNVQLMSSLVHMRLMFTNNKSGQSKKLLLILKKPIFDDALRTLLSSDEQFHNECVFYRSYALPKDNFPRCYYVDERPPIDSVIALEDVTARGYKPYQSSRHAVSLSYTLEAVRELARFHGKGYAMKQHQPDEFDKIKEQLQEVRYKKSNGDFEVFLNTVATRVVEGLREDPDQASFCNAVERLLSNAFEEIMMKTIEPIEPLATLCHGDFTANNLLFKPHKTGELSTMLIDFALLTYATPVVDLSTYFCLCCSHGIRQYKFYDIMEAYHDALKEYLLQAGVNDIERFSLDALLKDFARGGLFGFVIASFYLPALMGNLTINPEMMKTDTKKWIKVTKEAGGYEMTLTLTEMLLQLKDYGCLEHVL